MKSICSSLLLVLITLSCLQSQSIEPYLWDTESIEPYVFPDDLKTSLIIKKHVQYELTLEEEIPLILSTIHLKIAVNSNEDIEKTNKIYIPFKGGDELLSLEARTIRKDGTVVSFDKENLKQIDDSESNTSYLIFAIEGAENGSIIEYYYTKSSPITYFGRDFISTNFPIENYSFELISPMGIEYLFKMYNSDLTIAESIDSIAGFRNYKLQAYDVPVYIEEEMSDFDNSKPRLEYKIGFNHNGNGRKLNTWTNAANNISAKLTLTDRERNQLSSYWDKEEEMKKGLSLSQQVSFIENHIKSKFYIEDNATVQADSIAFVLENLFGSETGITKFFMGTLSYLNLSPQLCMLAKRGEFTLDPDFESFRYLTDYLIYLEELSVYIAPNDLDYRVGLLPHQLTSCYVLHFIEEDFGAFKKHTAECRWIDASDKDGSMDNMFIEISFSSDLHSNTIETERVMSGHASSFYKVILPRLEPEQMKMLKKGFIEFQSVDPISSKVVFTPESFDHTNWNKPLNAKTSVDTEEYVEEAGDVILLSIGKVIGPQSELYQEKERIFDVHNVFNRSYYRTISMHIPKGYEVINLEDLLISKKSSFANEVVFKFESTYNIENEVLRIEIDEFYNKIDFPVEQFEEFRKVINAAADWNKVVLALEPK